MGLSEPLTLPRRVFIPPNLIKVPKNLTFLFGPQQPVIKVLFQLQYLDLFLRTTIFSTSTIMLKLLIWYFNNTGLYWSTEVHEWFCTYLGILRRPKPCKISDLLGFKLHFYWQKLASVRNSYSTVYSVLYVAADC